MISITYKFYNILEFDVQLPKKREEDSENDPADHWYRENIKKGQTVYIVLKEDQGTDKRVKGKVKAILTKKNKHTRGIKVRLETGEVGRVQKILSK